MKTSTSQPQVQFHLSLTCDFICLISYYWGTLINMAVAFYQLPDGSKLVEHFRLTCHDSDNYVCFTHGRYVMRKRHKSGAEGQTQCCLTSLLQIHPNKTFIYFAKIHIFQVIPNIILISIEILLLPVKIYCSNQSYVCSTIVLSDQHVIV